MAIVNLLQVCRRREGHGHDSRAQADMQDHYLVMMTRKGMIKRTPYSEFANLRKAGLIAIDAARGR